MNLKSVRPLITIVDDDAAVCRAMKRLLYAYEMDTATFSSGRAFIEFLDSTPSLVLDCVILDVQMPDMNGLQVQELLVAKRPGIPVIFITAEGGDRIEQLLASGAAAVFQKPIDADAVLRILRWALASGKN